LLKAFVSAYTLPGRWVAAGPLSSLIWAMMALGLGWWMEEEATQSPSIVTKTLVWLLCLSGLFSAFIFAATAIPISTPGGFLSDGARLISLLRGGPSADFEQAILSTIGLLAEGKRYGEFPEQIIERLAVPGASTVTQLGALSATMLHHLERGRPDLAESFAQRLAMGLEASPVFIQHAYGRDLVFYYAFFEQKQAEAEAWRAKIGPYAEKQADATWYRIKAALAILNGQRDEAVQAIEKAKVLTPKLMLSGLQHSETYWIERLEARLLIANNKMVVSEGQASVACVRRNAVRSVTAIPKPILPTRAAVPVAGRSTVYRSSNVLVPVLADR